MALQPWGGRERIQGGNPGPLGAGGGQGGAIGARFTFDSQEAQRDIINLTNKTNDMNKGFQLTTKQVLLAAGGFGAFSLVSSILSLDAIKVAQEFGKTSEEMFRFQESSLEAKAAVGEFLIDALDPLFVRMTEFNNFLANEFGKVNEGEQTIGAVVEDVARRVLPDFFVDAPLDIKESNEKLTEDIETQTAPLTNAFNDWFGWLNRRPIDDFNRIGDFINQGGEGANPIQAIQDAQEWWDVNHPFFPREDTAFDNGGGFNIPNEFGTGTIGGDSMGNVTNYITIPITTTPEAVENADEFEERVRRVMNDIDFYGGR